MSEKLKLGTGLSVFALAALMVAVEEAMRRFGTDQQALVVSSKTIAVLVSVGSIAIIAATRDGSSPKQTTKICFPGEQEERKVSNRF